MLISIRRLAAHRDKAEPGPDFPGVVMQSADLYIAAYRQHFRAIYKICEPHFTRLYGTPNQLLTCPIAESLWKSAAEAYGNLASRRQGLPRGRRLLPRYTAADNVNLDPGGLRGDDRGTD